MANSLRDEDFAALAELIVEMVDPGMGVWPYRALAEGEIARCLEALSLLQLEGLVALLTSPNEVEAVQPQQAA